MTPQRIMSCVAAALFLPVFAPSAPAAEPAPAPGAAAVVIAKAETPVKIDGSLDDPCWQTATPIPVNFVFGKTGERDPEVPMTVRYAWDENYLYIGYETFDKNIVAVGTGHKEGPPGNQREGCEIDVPGKKVDVIEFFVSFGDSHFMWELHHNALNQFNDIWVTVPDPQWPISKTTRATYGIIFATQEFLQDDGKNTVAMAVKMKPKADGSPSTPNDPSDVDTGYTGEVRLPWRAIGVVADWYRAPTKTDPGGWNMTGHSVSLLAVVQDGDRELRYHHSSPTFPGGWFHQGMKNWPVYQFVGSPPEK